MSKKIDTYFDLDEGYASIRKQLEAERKKHGHDCVAFTSIDWFVALALQEIALEYDVDMIDVVRGILRVWATSNKTIAAIGGDIISAENGFEPQLVGASPSLTLHGTS